MLRQTRFQIWLVFILVAIVLAGHPTPSSAAPPHLGERILKQGMTGPDVSELQTLLGTLGFRPGPVDAYFGPQTTAAAKAFQKQARLPVDGVVGPATVEALRRSGKPSQGQFVPAGSGAPNKVHVVAVGETLTSIALSYGFDLAALLSANSIADPDRIYAGQVLRLPGNDANLAVFPPAGGSSAAKEATGQAAAPAPRGRIALTFDDGPDPELTLQVLDILSRAGARATFFVIGNRAEQYPDLIRRMVREGHEIANHSYSHRDLRSLGDREASLEIGKTALVVERITGRRTVFLRPPFGNWDSHLERLARGLGQKTVFWDNVIARSDRTQLVQGARDRQVIMLHDTRAAVVEMLPALLDELRQAGYQLVTLSELDRV